MRVQWDGVESAEALAERARRAGQEEWVQAVDEFGRVFYIDQLSGNTAWDVPEGQSYEAEVGGSLGLEEFYASFPKGHVPGPVPLRFELGERVIVNTGYGSVDDVWNLGTVRRRETSHDSINQPINPPPPKAIQRKGERESKQASQKASSSFIHVSVLSLGNAPLTDQTFD